MEPNAALNISFVKDAIVLVNRGTPSNDCKYKQSHFKDEKDEINLLIHRGGNVRIAIGGIAKYYDTIRKLNAQVDTPESVVAMDFVALVHDLTIQHDQLDVKATDKVWTWLYLGQISYFSQQSSMAFYKVALLDQNVLACSEEVVEHHGDC